MSRLRSWRGWWRRITAAAAAALPLPFLRGRLLLSGDAGRQHRSNEQCCCENRSTLQAHRH
jgi:hypothetical protein